MKTGRRSVSGCDNGKCNSKLKQWRSLSSAILFILRRSFQCDALFMIYNRVHRNENEANHITICDMHYVLPQKCADGNDSTAQRIQSSTKYETQRNTRILFDLLAAVAHLANKQKEDDEKKAHNKWNNQIKNYNQRIIIAFLFDEMDGNGKFPGKMRIF